MAHNPANSSADPAGDALGLTMLHFIHWVLFVWVLFVGALVPGAAQDKSPPAKQDQPAPTVAGTLAVSVPAPPVTTVVFDTSTVSGDTNST